MLRKIATGVVTLKEAKSSHETSTEGKSCWQVVAVKFVSVSLVT
jgi:hypothetical protein